MSLSIKLDKKKKLDVWQDDKRRVPHHLSEVAQVFPIDGNKSCVAVTNGVVAAVVAVAGTCDAETFIPTKALAFKSTEKSVSVTCTVDGEISRDAAVKDGVEHMAYSECTGRDIIGGFPDLSDGPIACIQLNPRMLLEACRAMGLNEYSDTVRIVFNIQQVPYIQLGMADLIEFTKPQRDELITMLREYDVRPPYGSVGVVSDGNGYSISHTYGDNKESLVHKDQYWVPIQHGVDTPETLADKLLAEWEVKQADRMIALPQPSKAALLMGHPYATNFATIMPVTSRRQLTNETLAIKRSMGILQELKDKRTAAAKQPF